MLRVNEELVLVHAGHLSSGKRGRDHFLARGAGGLARLRPSHELPTCERRHPADFRPRIEHLISRATEAETWHSTSDLAFDDTKGTVGEKRVGGLALIYTGSREYGAQHPQHPSNTLGCHNLRERGRAQLVRNSTMNLLLTVRNLWFPKSSATPEHRDVRGNFGENIREPRQQDGRCCARAERRRRGCAPRGSRASRTQKNAHAEGNSRTIVTTPQDTTELSSGRTSTPEIEVEKGKLPLNHPTRDTPQCTLAFRISRCTARAWRTASTTFPVPASPFVRSIAAPSATRRCRRRATAPRNTGENDAPTPSAAVQITQTKTGDLLGGLLTGLLRRTQRPSCAQDAWHKRLGFE